MRMQICDSGTHAFVPRIWLSLVFNQPTPFSECEYKALINDTTETYEGLYMLTRAFNQWLPHRHQAGFNTSLFTLAACIVVVIVQYINLCVYLSFICSTAVCLWFPVFGFCCSIQQFTQKTVGFVCAILNVGMKITIHMYAAHFNEMERPQQRNDI